VRRRHVQFEHLDEPCQAWGLALGELEHQARQCGGVDDRVLERALEAPAHQPRVEGVMAVLDEHSALSETQERTARVAKLGRADEHGPVDVVAPVRVGVDRRLAVDERVEEGQRAIQTESLRADLQDQER
jgi:hypothetical protein